MGAGGEGADGGVRHMVRRRSGAIVYGVNFNFSSEEDDNMVKDSLIFV